MGVAVSERSDLADRIAAWVGGQHGVTNVSQKLQTRDDGGPGGGRSISFTRNGIDYQLVVWKPNRLDMHTSNNFPGTWTRFSSEDEFYSYAQAVWHIQGPIKQGPVREV